MVPLEQCMEPLSLYGIIDLNKIVGTKFHVLPALELRWLSMTPAKYYNYCCVGGPKLPEFCGPDSWDRLGHAATTYQGKAWGYSQYEIIHINAQLMRLTPIRLTMLQHHYLLKLYRVSHAWRVIHRQSCMGELHICLRPGSWNVEEPSAGVFSRPSVAESDFVAQLAASLFVQERQHTAQK